MFPDTPKTLIKRIAELRDSNDAVEWEKFVELYTPPLQHFVRLVGRGQAPSGGLSPSEIDDVVQEIFVKLVEVLRTERIDRTKGRFRDYLAAMTRRLLIDRYRAALVRPQSGTVPIDSGSVPGDSSPFGNRQVDKSANRQISPWGQTPPSPGTVPIEGMDPGAALDIKWRLAVHNAAVEHVLTKTAISKQSADVYRALTGRGQTPKEVARQFGLSYDAVKQIKSRIDRAIAAVEKQLSANA